jgi:hypothetical protein
MATSPLNRRPSTKTGQIRSAPQGKQDEDQGDARRMAEKGGDPAPTENGETDIHQRPRCRENGQTDGGYHAAPRSHADFL